MKNYSPAYLRWHHTDMPAVKERQLQQAMAEHPEDHMALHYQLALFYLVHENEGSFEKMKAASHHLVEQGQDAEDYSTGYELMAICYEHLKNDEEMAIRYYKVSLEHCPSNESSLTRLGSLYMQKKMYKEALLCFQMLEQCDPQSSLTELGTAYLELMEYEQAEYYLTAALAQGGTIEVYNGLGRCAAEKGANKTSLDYFRQSLAKSPNDAVTNYYAGIVYQRQNDLYRALHHYTLAVNAWPEFSDAYNNIAVCYDSLGDDPQTALDYFNKALETDPPPQLRSLLYMNLARFHGQRMNFDLQDHYQRKLLQELGFDPGEESS